MAGKPIPPVAPVPPAPSPRPTPAAEPQTATPAAAQIAPVLVQLAHAAGSHRTTVQLNPDELGHVQVRIERAPDGSAAVQVVAERPETLKLLIQDQAQLHRALDNAGVPQDGRTLNLSLGAPPSGGAGADMGADMGSPGQSSGGGQPDRGAPRRPPHFATAAARAGWQRAGIDITA